MTTFDSAVSRMDHLTISIYFLCSVSHCSSALVSLLTKLKQFVFVVHLLKIDKGVQEGIYLAAMQSNLEFSMRLLVD